MADLKLTLAAKGRLVAHNIEFDAGVLAAELSRVVGAGLLSPDHHRLFTRAAEEAYCTMNACVRDPYPLRPSIELAYQMFTGTKAGPPQHAEWRAEKAAEMYAIARSQGGPP